MSLIINLSVEQSEEYLPLLFFTKFITYFYWIQPSLLVLSQITYTGSRVLLLVFIKARVATVQVYLQ